MKTIVKDIKEYESRDELLESRITVANYISILDSLYLTANQEAFSINYGSSKRIGKSAKRHLIDPSLACAILDLSIEKLLNNHNTFVLLFEALVERDLRIYMVTYIILEIIHQVKDSLTIIKFNWVFRLYDFYKITIVTNYFNKTNVW